MILGTNTNSEGKTGLTIFGKELSEISADKKSGMSLSTSIFGGNNIATKQIEQIKRYAEKVDNLKENAFGELSDIMSDCTKEQRTFAAQCGTNSASIRQLASDTEQVGVKATFAAVKWKFFAFVFDVAIASIATFAFSKVFTTSKTEEPFPVPRLYISKTVSSFSAINFFRDATCAFAKSTTKI